MEILKQIGFYLGKYLASSLFIFAGILILASASEEQPQLYMIGGVGMILAGIISVLYIADVISGMVHLIMLGVIVIGAAVYGYFVYDSIMSKIRLEASIAAHEKEVKQRLKDLRDAQLEYFIVNNKYCTSFDSLKLFVRTGYAFKIDKIGDVPEKLETEQWKFLGYKEPPATVISEVEAWKLSKAGLLNGFKRDTTKIAVMDKLFASRNYLASRQSIYKFNIDSMDVVPDRGGKEKFEMHHDTLIKNNVPAAVFCIWEPKPLRDTLQVGSKTEVTTNGNWGE
jgi:hypothetical protein